MMRHLIQQILLVTTTVCCFQVYANSNQVIHQGVFFQSDSQGTPSKMNADYTELESSTGKLKMRGVYALVLNSSFENQYDIRSQYAYTTLGNDEVQLVENVQFKSQSGYEAHTDMADFDRREKTVRTQSNIKIFKKKEGETELSIQGVGLVGNLNNHYFKVLSKVNAERKLNQNKLFIQSNNAEFWSNNKRAVFNGKVNCKKEKIKIKSDVLEVTSEEDNDVFFASGNVQLEQNKKTGKANRVQFYSGSDQIVLEGDALVSSNGDQIQGEKIIMHQGGDRIEVVKALGKITSESATSQKPQ